MKGERVLRDHYQCRTRSRKLTLNGCEMKRNLDNIVVVDVDSERLDDVIIIDIPESLQHKKWESSVSRKGKKIQFGGIISIDDDEDAGRSEMGTDNGVDLESDSSSNKSCRAPEHVNKSVNLGDDEYQAVQEKNYAFRVSKCKKSSGKDPYSNCYGLFESSSSDSDDSDCEVMEGSFGRLHKEWAKAYLKRKYNEHQVKSDVDDQASPSSLNNDSCPDVVIEVERWTETEQNSKTFFCCNSSSGSYDKKSFKPFVQTYDQDLDTVSLNLGMKCPPVESEKKLDEERNSSPKEADFLFGGETFMEDPLSNPSWWQCYKHKDGGSGSSFHDDGQSPPGPFFWTNQEENNKNHYRRTGDMDKQKNFMGAHFNFLGINRNFHHKTTSFEYKEDSLFRSQQSSETHDNTEQVVLSEKNEEFSQTSSSCSSSSRKSVSIEKDKPASGDMLVSTSRPSCETLAACGVPAYEYTAGRPDVEKPDSEGLSTYKTQCTEQQSNRGSPISAEIKQKVIDSLSNNTLNGGADPRHTKGVTPTPTSADDMINEREKLKETDEYKRAMEEEWASRQRQLQIQAEEAQRLRKKKRAESMRLLGMERRQKQRLEEIRETQKKDEENMNLKEKLRGEVRKELNKLETTCIDMSSLLHALGINVGGSFRPLSQEVHAAYKRALLRFHPDRASKTDVREQVEAEEKFKLISRMKEKFLLTTCH